MDNKNDDYHHELIDIIARSDWFMSALYTVKRLQLKSWCIGAGAVRNLVWDHLHGYAKPTALTDVDVAYFDSGEPPGMDISHQEKLETMCPDLPWEIINQAHVHLWFEEYFGYPVRPLSNLEDALSTWPEFATCVGITLRQDSTLEVIAPHGLEDLFTMKIRRNPSRASVETYRSRIAHKRYTDRWSRVKVIEE